jgi:hypothetical protein
MKLLSKLTYRRMLFSKVKKYIALNIMYDLRVWDFIDWIWDFYWQASSAVKHNQRKIGTKIQGAWGNLFENCELIDEWK